MSSMTSAGHPRATHTLKGSHSPRHLAFFDFFTSFFNANFRTTAQPTRSAAVFAHKACPGRTSPRLAFSLKYTRYLPPRFLKRRRPPIWPSQQACPGQKPGFSPGFTKGPRSRPGKLDCFASRASSRNPSSSSRDKSRAGPDRDPLYGRYGRCGAPALASNAFHRHPAAPSGPDTPSCRSAVPWGLDHAAPSNHRNRRSRPQLPPIAFWQVAVTRRRVLVARIARLIGRRQYLHFLLHKRQSPHPARGDPEPSGRATHRSCPASVSTVFPAQLSLHRILVAATRPWPCSPRPRLHGIAACLS